jgi:SAM-dependent methyltransferase
MRVADYDSISAGGYDVRYREYEHHGIEGALVSFLGAPGRSRALEVGAGTGHWVQFLSEYRVVGLDISDSMLARAQGQPHKAPLVQADALALPFADGSFDRLVCVNAFHHFGNKHRFLGEARRVLRPAGGFVSIGLDPHSGRDSWWIYDYFPETIDLDQQRYLSVGALRSEMARTGFARCETREVEHIVAKMSVDSARAKGHFDRSFTSQFTILTDEEFRRGLKRILDADGTTSDRSTALLLQSDLRLYATTGWAE